MRKWHSGFLRVIVIAAFAAVPAQAHFANKASIYFRGDTPRLLCYTLDKDVADDPLWVSWIDNAIAAWQKADTGWTFKKCETDDEKAHPDIQFSFNHKEKKIPGGAEGGPESDSHWQIRIEPNVDGENINDVVVKGGIKGWRMTQENGEVTLDPVLVMEHEISHALGLDHTPGTCAKDDVEEPICAGKHGNPKERLPSANDVAEVKKAIAFVQKAQKEAAEKAAAGEVKRNHREHHPVYSEDDPRFMDQPDQSGTAPRTATHGHHHYSEDDPRYLDEHPAPSKAEYHSTRDDGYVPGYRPTTGPDHDTGDNPPSNGTDVPFMPHPGDLPPPTPPH